MGLLGPHGPRFDPLVGRPLSYSHIVVPGLCIRPADEGGRAQTLRLPPVFGAFSLSVPSPGRGGAEWGGSISIKGPLCRR
jgi:hypothetical protein